MNPDTLSRYGESDIRQEIFRMSTQVILFFLSAVTAGLVIVIAYQRYAILVREEFSCLINSHEQGHEQLDSGKLNTGGHK